MFMWKIDPVDFTMCRSLRGVNERDTNNQNTLRTRSALCSIPPQPRKPRQHDTLPDPKATRATHRYGKPRADHPLREALQCRAVRQARQDARQVAADRKPRESRSAVQLVTVGPILRYGGGLLDCTKQGASAT